MAAIACALSNLFDKVHAPSTRPFTTTSTAPQTPTPQHHLLHDTTMIMTHIFKRLNQRASNQSAAD